MTRGESPAVVIEDVGPSVDGGRYPVKRIIGDVLRVQATAYREGHELVAGSLRYREPGDRVWRATPMAYDERFDRLTCDLPLDRLGRWMFTVEAWTDRFGTWRRNVQRSAAAGVDLEADLLEGAELVAAAARRVRGFDRKILVGAAAVLRDTTQSIADRVATAARPEVGRLVARFLPAPDTSRHQGSFPVVVDRPVAGFAAWYEMFPRSQPDETGGHGTFETAARQLPRIADLGFDVVYLPPIHPIGMTRRKGRNGALVAAPEDPGSPWGIGNAHGGHTAVEPRLGTIEDFDRFVGAARALGLEVALDYALHCSPDHSWLQEHPEWFYKRPDGTIRHAENPPMQYEDIHPLDFHCVNRRALWEACRDICLFWIEHGVRIFRVDNPHTKPFGFWEWLIDDIKGAHPDVLFLSEGFTRPARMKGLAKLGFCQSYTYFIWRTTAAEIGEYFTELTQAGMAEYFRPHLFPTTPDVLHEYLQRGGRAAFRVRLVLAATLSPLYGIISGYELCENAPREPGSVEYLGAEAFEIRRRNWDLPGHINDDIRLVNRIRRGNGALQALANVTFHPTDNEQILFYHKHASGNDLLIGVNLDPNTAQQAWVLVPLERLGLRGDEPFQVEDLLTGARYTWKGARNYVRLDPAEQVAHIFRVIPPGTAT